MTYTEEGAYLLKVELEHVRCFENKAVLDLSDGTKWRKWTVILGNNGTGKTTLLQIISNFRTHLKDIPQNNGGTMPGYYPEFVRQSSYGVISPNYIGDDRRNLSNIQAYIRLKTSLSFNDEYDMMYSQTDFFSNGVRINYSPRYSLLKIYGYGANRFMNQTLVADTKSSGNATLFNENAWLVNAEEWLLQLDYSASKKSQVQEFAIERREQVIEVLVELLPDIEEIRFTEPTKENLKSSVEFKTVYGYWVTIHQLSLGYKTMVAWMVDLAARLFERYHNSDNPLAQPAIVLVDEIDLHMHPQWQRKIFDYLSEKFPKTQFIVTAHSPLIVQSAPKDANIVLLRREGDHVVIDNDIKSVHNWRIDQILNSDLFGNIPSRSESVEEWMEERKRLIQKSELSEDEKVRLKELNEKAHSLPTADNPRDIEAMEIIRKAADYLKSQTV